MADWKTHKSELVYETPWMQIYRDEVLNHKGKSLVYSYVKLPHPAVTIVAVNQGGQILLQKNYRYAIKQKLWEVPAGHSDGQDPLTAAQRELSEEAGLTSSEWSSLGEARLGTGIADIHHYFFLARNVQKSNDERDEDEDISEQNFFTYKEVRRMIADDEIVDGDSLIALYRYMMELEESK